MVFTTDSWMTIAVWVCLYVAFDTRNCGSFNAAVLSGLAVITSVLVVVVFLGVNRDMAKHYQEQAKFSLAKSYFQIVLKQIRSCRNT